MRNSIKQSISAAVAIGALALPLCARADVSGGEAQVTGRITAFIGKYELHIMRPNGHVDDVMMHQGTIINPTGLPLQNGMRVTVLGYQSGSTFDANEIDTPYVGVVTPYPGPYGGDYGFGLGLGFGRFGGFYR